MNSFIERHEPFVQRALEIFPGFTAWMIIIFPFWGSYFFPEFVAYVVLIFMVFWLYRSTVLGFLVIRGYRMVKKHSKIDWPTYFKETVENPEFEWDEPTHVVIVPRYNEAPSVIRRSLDRLKEQEIAKKQMVVVLALEEKVDDHKEISETMLGEYQHHFKMMLTTHHPVGLPNEVPGKSANERWAALHIKKLLIDEQGYDINKVTITSCDSDARFHPRYFSSLNYNFITNQHRYNRFWQSPIFEHNNITQVPAFVRIVGVFSGAHHLSDIQEPRRLSINYSSYSTSLKLLNRIDYWDPMVIPEDWHIFLRAFFGSKGEIEVEPIYLPTNIDAAESSTYLGSLINRYEQCKRHAWGVTLVPYVVKEYFAHPEIPLFTRTLRVFKVIEANLLWAISWFYVTLSASIPPLINPAFEQTVLGQNLPRLAGTILTFSLGTMFVSIAVDSQLRPPELKTAPWWKKPFFLLEWFLMPIATLFMSALPGIHAQTRLMLGRYMNYKVTDKV